MPATRATGRGRMRSAWMKSHATANSKDWRGVGREDGAGMGSAPAMKDRWGPGWASGGGLTPGGARGAGAANWRDGGGVGREDGAGMGSAPAMKDRWGPGWASGEDLTSRG